MATLIVNTDTGVDYASLALAEAALPATLTESYVIECSGATDDVSKPKLDGNVVNGFSVTVRGEAVTSAGWDDNKYTLAALSGNSFESTIDNTVLLDLQVKAPPTSYDYGVKTSGANLLVDRMLIDCNNNILTGSHGLLSNNGPIIRNSVAFNGGVRTISTDSASAGGAYVQNCTVYNSGGYGFYTGYLDTVYQNCLSLDSATADFSPSTYSTSDYNASSDSTAPGSNSLTSQVATDLMTDPANGDFTLKAGSNAIGAGTDLSAFFTTDITGATRSTPWDIGAFLYSVGGAFTLDADSGSYTITGQTASLLRDSKLAADPGSYTITGQAASLLRDSQLSADSGSYLTTGQIAALLIDRVLSAGLGSLTLTGQEATLIYTPVGGFTLTADSGIFTLTGGDADLLAGYNVTAETGAVTLDGQAAALLYGRLLAAGSGDFSLTGSDIDFLRDYKLSSESGSLVLDGQDVTLIYSGIILPDGRVRITFTARQPGAAISARTPSITISAT